MRSTVDQVLFILSVIAFFATTVSLAVTLRNERRRRLRSRFRRVIAAHLDMPVETVEEKLADATIAAVSRDEVEDLNNISLEQCVEAYIADPGFQPRFADLLRARRDAENIKRNMRPEVMYQVEKVVQGWKDRDLQELRASIEHTAAGASDQDKDAEIVKKYICPKRKDFVTETFDNFVKDYTDSVQEVFETEGR